MSTENEKKSTKHIYFVDNVRYETEHTSLTGAQIKAQIPNFDQSYQLFLEEHDDKPDLLVTDDTTVTLEKEKGPRRLYTVPPATFGR